MFEIGDVIRKVRKEKQMSGEQLAKKSGIGHMTISEIENGKGNPTLKTLNAIAEALKTDVASLFVRMRDELEPKRRRRVTEEELSLLDVWARVPADKRVYWRPLLDAAAEEGDRLRALGAEMKRPPTNSQSSLGGSQGKTTRTRRA